MADPWPVKIRVNGLLIENCSVGLPVTIAHGRSGVDSQPDAPSLKFTWIGQTFPGAIGDGITVDAEYRVGTAVRYDDQVEVYDSPTGVYDSNLTATQTAARFVGDIAGLKADEADGIVTSWEVECIGHQARLGFNRVWLTRPQETDVDRILAIASAAEVTIKILGTSTLQLVADNVEQDALGAIHQVCASSGGLFWQAPNGDLIYGTSNHRQTAELLGNLPCETIADGLSWQENVSTIVNHVTVKFGPENAQIERTFSDAASIAKPWGHRHVDATTVLASESDATTLAALILARRSEPFWDIPDARIYGALLEPLEEKLVSDLDVSSSVVVPFEAKPSPVPTANRPAMVEGWIETWDSTHDFQIALSDSARWVTTTSQNWTQMRASGSWNTWKAQTYLDALVVT